MVGAKRPRIELLRQNPAPGSERRHEPAKNLVSIWQMAENQAEMDEIEFCLRERIGCDVVPTDFQIRSVQRFEKSSVDVSRKHLPVAAYSVAEPRCDASSSSPDFQAMPTAVDADFRKVPDRSGVKDVGQG